MYVALLPPLEETGLTDMVRPNSSRATMLLLAKDLLGLPHEEPRRRREARTRPANHQPGYGSHWSALGMATTTTCGHRPAPLDRSAVNRIPAQRAQCAVDLPGHKLGAVLHHWHGSVLLGVQ